MLKYCSITGVNIKRFAVTLLAGFVFTWLYEFIVHSKLLMNTYLETPQLWRSQSEMVKYLPFMLLTQFLTVFITALIFTRHFESKGVGEGLRYGLLIGSLMGIMMCSSYAWMPISGFLATSWFFSGLIYGTGLGVIYSLTYKSA